MSGENTSVITHVTPPYSHGCILAALLTSLYPVGMCFAAIAPIPAAYMLSTKYSWKLFFYVALALAVALFILAFLFAEESSYDREAHRNPNTSTAEPLEGVRISNASDKPEEPIVEEVSSTSRRKTYLETLLPWGRVDPNINVVALVWRSFTYFLVPQVLWVITSFGIIIGLGALAFNFVFPIKITAPPYNWSTVRIYPFFFSL